MDFNLIITRVKNILLTPATEWPVIAAEAATPKGIYVGYVLVLAAVPAVLGFIDAAVFGYSIPFAGTVRVGIGSALSAAVTGYVLSVAGVFIMSHVVDALAPTFAAEKNPLQALKVVAYAYTAAWVGGAGTILPGIGALVMLAGGIYSIYLLYLGLQQLMKCPADKAAGYTAVVVIAGILIGWLSALVLSQIIGPVGMPQFTIEG